jgi:hypothetical protein
MAGELAAQRRLLEDIARRLNGIEATVGGHGILGRTVHVQQGVAALLRHARFDAAELPYPERLWVQRFRLASQNEEDGITLALLESAGMPTRRFVELGCGTNGGNSGFLVEELGFTGLMVDGDAAKADEARMRFGARGVDVRRAWITREDVDALVAGAGVEGEVDLLSIDIDGNDIWLWESLTAVRPRIVIVEYNSLFGADRAVAVPYEPSFSRRSIPRSKGQFYGASLAALERVGAHKGYRLVCTEHRGTDAFFLRDDVAPEIPAAPAPAAYRMMDKHRIAAAAGFDVFAFARDDRLDLVEVPA